MIRERAIEILKYNSNVIHKTMTGETDTNEVEALDMAIEALEGKHYERAIPIPDGATNGDMIMAMFPNAKANVFVKEVGVKWLDTYSTFTKKWWNAPYEGGKEE